VGTTLPVNWKALAQATAVQPGSTVDLAGDFGPGRHDGYWRKGMNRADAPYLPLTPEVVDAHLRGEAHIGLYPLSDDDTCWWVAADFSAGDEHVIVGYQPGLNVAPPPGGCRRGRPTRRFSSALTVSVCSRDSSVSGSCEPLRWQASTENEPAAH
jgi:hypothetical protein